MPNTNIWGAYKRKEYGWFVLLLVVLIATAQLAGLVGSAVSAVVLSLVYTTIKNDQYSLVKKILLSLAYVTGGVLLVMGGLLFVVFILKRTSGGGTSDVAYTDLAKEVLQYQTTSTVDDTMFADKNLDMSGVTSTYYVDAKNNFQIRPPIGWTIDASGKYVPVEFDDPTPGQVAQETVDLDSEAGATSTLQQSAANYIQGFSSAAGSLKGQKILSQGPFSIHGITAYKVEFAYTYPLTNQDVPMHSKLIVEAKNGVAYGILLTTQEKLWSQDERFLDASVSTFSTIK